MRWSVLVASALAQYSLPSNDGVGVQLFQWSFRDIARECVEFLGPNGYKYVQTSPVQQHARNTFDTYASQMPWYLMYQPTGYSIGNRLGSEQDFINMVNTCRNASVDVIVDVVLNHFTYVDRSDSKGFGGSDRPFTSVAFRQNFPDANYNASHFHDSICNRNIVDFNSYDEWWNCRLVTLVDLKTEDPFVRRSIAGFLNRMIAIGVAGFRVDVAVCVPPADWTAIYSQLNPIYNGNKAYISQEVFKVNGNYNEYPKLGRTINFEYGKQVGQAFRNLNGKTIDTLDSIFQSTGLTDRESTVIIENHDKERDRDGENDYALSRINGAWNYKQASAFLIAYPWGYPIVHSGYGIKWNGGTDDNREFPLTAPFDAATGLINSVGIINNNLCSNNWVCQHRWSDVFPLVKIRNWINKDAIAERPKITSLGPRSNKVYWNVPGKAFVLINSAQNNQPFLDAVFDVQTGLPAGTYCNMVYARAVGNSCVLWPGVVLSNREQVSYVVDATGKTTASVKDADKSRVLALYSGPDGVVGRRPPVTSPITSSTAPPAVTSSVAPPAPTGVPSGAVKVESFNFDGTTLTIRAFVQNIAFTKVVSVNFCDRSGSCTNSFSCSYSGPFTNGYELWGCTSSNFPRGITSFTMNYLVSGQNFNDFGPAGRGYTISTPGATTTDGPTQTLPTPTGVPVNPGPRDAVINFSVAGINVPSGQSLAVVKRVPQALDAQLRQVVNFPLTQTCDKNGCVWSGTVVIPDGLNVQIEWQISTISGDKTQCGGPSVLTALPSTFIFINQGPFKDNLFEGVRYINLDRISLC